MRSVVFLSTALHRAADHGHAGVCALLLERGAAIHAVNKDGKTALHYAAYYGYTDACALLQERGAVIEAVDNEGRTAHSIAVNRRYDDLHAIFGPREEEKVHRSTQ